jgi:hypothetical protein
LSGVAQTEPENKLCHHWWHRWSIFKCPERHFISIFNTSFFEVAEAFNLTHD